MCPESTKANQILTSGSFMAPFRFLFQEHLCDLIRGERRLRLCQVKAVDQGQFHPLRNAQTLRLQLRRLGLKNAPLFSKEAEDAADKSC